VLEGLSDPEEARQRIKRRREAGGDPSDADAAVISRQLSGLETIGEGERQGLPLVCRGSLQGLRGMERWLSSRN
jgi:hypothetical protein